MKFPFPFPTLQQLASQQIAVHIANAKIGPYRRFPEAVWDRRFPVRLLSMDLEEIVEDWNIPEPLKPSLSVVVLGVFHQLYQWLSRLGQCLHHLEKWKEHFVANFRHMEIVFDVHGRLDVTAIWDRFFVSKMATISAVEPLFELLEVAVFYQQLNHIDAIFRKVVDIWDSGTELDGPRYTCSEGEILSMRYGFKERHSQSTFRVLRSKFHQHTDSVFVNEDGITITIFGTWMNVQAFETYVRSRDIASTSRVRIADFTSTQSANSSRQLLESFSETEFNERLRTSVRFQRILENFVVWPFAQFVFLPLLRDLHTSLRISDFFILFLAIIERMPSREEFGAYYNDIFLEFWNGMSADNKRYLFNNLLEANMAWLGTLQRKNPSLYLMVVQEFRALLQRHDELVEMIMYCDGNCSALFMDNQQ